MYQPNQVTNFLYEKKKQPDRIIAISIFRIAIKQLLHKYTTQLVLNVRYNKTASVVVLTPLQSGECRIIFTIASI